MPMENLPESNSSSTTPKSLDSLISEWCFRFRAEHEKDARQKLPLWLEAFLGMQPRRPRKTFHPRLSDHQVFPKGRRDSRTAREHQASARFLRKRSRVGKVLAIRREHFNEDFPEHCTRALATLPERMQRAARASGIFQEVSDPTRFMCGAKSVLSSRTWHGRRSRRTNSFCPMARSRIS